MDSGFQNVRYRADLGVLILNEWVFEDRYPEDRRFVCARSSGPSDYVAEWWHVGDSYKLMWVPYRDLELKKNMNVRDQGKLLKEVDTLHDVLVYCFTHLHPDI